jgi:NAD(P)-dependent dehydrogenase (short-subunit alcohol dehydrogenase family)
LIVTGYINLKIEDAFNKGRVSMGILDRFRLDGKKALVTGGGQGLGRAYVRTLAEAGADIAVVDINIDTAQDAAREVEFIGRKSLWIKADVSKVSDIYKMVDEVISEWGRLDIAINNAGASEVISALNISEESWDNILDLDLKGTFFCAQAEAKVMIPNKYGKIVNISSILGYMVNHTEYQVPYCVAKSGVVHLTKCLAAEWAPFGIRVNCVTPGYIQTPAIELPVFKDIKHIWVEQTPLGRLGTVEDLQAAVVYLSSEVSDFMTGNDMVIDGGFLLIK